MKCIPQNGCISGTSMSTQIAVRSSSNKRIITEIGDTITQDLWYFRLLITRLEDTLWIICLDVVT